MINELLFTSALLFSGTPKNAQSFETISYGKIRYTDCYVQLGTTMTRFFDVEFDWTINDLGHNESSIFYTFNVYVSNIIQSSTTSITWEHIESIDYELMLDLDIYDIYALEFYAEVSKTGNYLTYESYCYVNQGDYDNIIEEQNLIPLQRYFTSTTNLKLMDLVEYQPYNVYETGFSTMYNQGYDNYSNTTEAVNNRLDAIWNILERGIEAVLSVLSIEVLPGIPLYICLVVPILFGLLLWFIKLGAS